MACTLLLLTAFPAVMAYAGPLGLGIVLGEPTGVTAKYRLSAGTAVDATVSWSLMKDQNMYIHASWLQHFSGPFYFGVGVALHPGGKGWLGGRVPFGASLYLSTPFELFAEVAPTFYIIPDMDFKLHGGIGIRYYF
jgi:hypothetical protein